MSLKLALRAISKKVTSKAGKVLGSPLRAVEPAHSGGFRQSFDNGVVYWHASTGAAIVRGNIGVGYAAR